MKDIFCLTRRTPRLTTDLIQTKMAGKGYERFARIFTNNFNTAQRNRCSTHSSSGMPNMAHQYRQRYPEPA